MKNKLILAFIFFLHSSILFAQDTNEKYVEPGIVVQQYPTGFLLGIRTEVGLANHHALEIRLGYNLLDHQDFGEHEDEEGGGFGGSLGYRYYFKPNYQKWFAGIRTDVWFNEIDWKDNIGELNEVTETTKVTVLQPTVVAGYHWALNDHLALIPTIALGAEINIKTKGAEVGQGAIILWGLSLAYRF